MYMRTHLEECEEYGIRTDALVDLIFETILPFQELIHIGWDKM